jgi:hypothetical protein
MIAALIHVSGRQPETIKAGKMRTQQTNDGETLALGALGWVLASEVRAERLLALTGLTPEGLRARVQDRDFLAAVLRFIETHEPDLIACADALGIAPLAMVAARQELEA